MFNSPQDRSGPLLGLHGFDPSCIRWCFMHVVHLGLLYTVNGSGLKLASKIGYPQVCCLIFCVVWICHHMAQAPGRFFYVCSFSLGCNVALQKNGQYVLTPQSCARAFGKVVQHTLLRNLLLQGGFFGSEAGLPLNVKLSRAYRLFREFCSRNKIECSQPEFTSRMVSSIIFRQVFSS